jgi:hypothetical protein
MDDRRLSPEPPVPHQKRNQRVPGASRQRPRSASATSTGDLMRSTVEQSAETEVMLEVRGAVGAGGPARLREAHDLPQRCRRAPGPRRITLVTPRRGDARSGPRAGPEAGRGRHVRAWFGSRRPDGEEQRGRRLFVACSRGATTPAEMDRAEAGMSFGRAVPRAVLGEGVGAPGDRATSASNLGWSRSVAPRCLAGNAIRDPLDVSRRGAWRGGRGARAWRRRRPRASRS